MMSWKSRKLSIPVVLFLVMAIASVSTAAGPGDISGKIFKKIDGRAAGFVVVPGGERVILLAGRELMLFDPVSGKKINSYQFGTSEMPLRLDLFDVDSNGALEAAVTVMISAEPSSYIFKLAGDNFTIFLKGLPYFFRVMSGSGGDDILLGQTSSSVEPFAGSVFEMAWNSRKMKKKAGLDLPKGTGIYQFAAASPASRGKHIWIRGEEGHLNLFEKRGRKWKKIYRTSEKYRGDVNCVLFKKYEVITEDREIALCVPVPPAVIDGYIIVDRHDFTLSGVVLDPALPRRAYVDILKFDEDEGLLTCREWGPYQGWIGDISRTEDTIFVLRNTSEWKRGVRLDKLNISNIDCKDKF